MTHSETPFSHNENGGLLPENGTSPGEKAGLSDVPFRPVRGNAELGEVDTAEDAIDGMGAIKFTDEEDCGYFGMLSCYLSNDLL